MQTASNRLPAAWTGLAALALFAASAAPPASAAPHLVRTFPNKTTVIVRQVSTRPVVSIQAWVRAGARDAPSGQRGAAGVLARCIFKQTERRGRDVILKEIVSMGGSAGSESRYGYTVFSLNVPARYANQALDLLADGLVHSQLDSSVVRPAKDLERLESERRLTPVDQAAINVVREELHAGTPLTAPLAVPEIEIETLTPAMVQNFYRTHYVAENLTIVAVGDVDPASFAQRAERVLADMPAGRAAKRSRVNERSFQGPRTVVARARKGVQDATVVFGFRAPVWGTADALALDALMALLVDSPTSRIRERLEAAETAFTSSAAYRDFGPDGGTITLSLVGPAASLADAEGALLAELEKARSAPVSARELEDAVRTVGNRELYPRTQFPGIAMATALAHFQGMTGGDEITFDRLRALKPEDLVAVARKYLDLKQCVVVEMAPDADLALLGAAPDLARRLKEKQAVYAAAYRSGPPATASDDAERRARVDASVAAIPTAPAEAGRGRVERIPLEGGARLLVGEDRSAPVVAIGVYLAGGVRYENDLNNGVTALIKELLLNAIDPKGGGRPYRHSLATMGNLTPYQDRDMWGYSITVPRETYPEALRRLMAMIAHPETDTVAVDAARLMILGQIDRFTENEDAQRQRLIFATKYQISGYRLAGLGSHGTIIKMQHETIVGFMKKFLVQPNLVIAAFGDVRASEIRPTVEEALRDVAPGPFDPGTIPKEGTFTGFREKWELGGGDYTTVTLAFDGPPASSSDIPAFYVINSLFSGPKGWFEQFVRTQDFVKDVTSSVAYAIDESPLIATVSASGREREEDAAMLLFRQYKKVALLPLQGEAATELINAKTHAIGSYCTALDSNSGRAFHYARAEVFGLSLDTVATLPARMEILSASDLTAVGGKYFQKDDFARRPYAITETRIGGW